MTLFRSVLLGGLTIASQTSFAQPVLVEGGRVQRVSGEEIAEAFMATCTAHFPNRSKIESAARAAGFTDQALRIVNAPKMAFSELGKDGLRLELDPINSAPTVQACSVKGSTHDNVLFGGMAAQVQSKLQLTPNKKLNVSSKTGRLSWTSSANVPSTINVWRDRMLGLNFSGATIASK